MREETKDILNTVEDLVDRGMVCGCGRARSATNVGPGIGVRFGRTTRVYLKVGYQVLLPIQFSGVPGMDRH